MYNQHMIKRTIKEKLLSYVKDFPVTLVTGARQVGKSTLCLEIKDKFNWNYVSLDVKENLNLATKDPNLFFETFPCPLIIDEIQKAPSLFSEIAPLVNESRYKKENPNGMFILTGSHQFELMKNVSESLAGRVGILTIPTLTFNEIQNREAKPFEIIPNLLLTRNDSEFTRQKLLERIIRGSYPELYRMPQLDSVRFYESYLKTYLEKDVKEILSVQNKALFKKFLGLLATYSGCELIYANLAKTLNIDIKTVMSWVGILETSNIIYLLQPYFESSLSKRVIKRPKIYFNDTGLACFLLKQNDPVTLSKGIAAGHLIETYVINEIIKSYLNESVLIPNFYYYRDRDQNEIDLIMLKNGSLNLIEIKSGTRFDESDVKAFRKLNSSEYQIDNCAIICTTKIIYPINKKTYVLPVSVI
ncbi:ATP-binding protein [[Mycoplasma] testudinis]|uniref:ATP-binding protein n=1 Tax=[Mycoplasma] testudinis TaxID=33924 RepID=UPI000485C57A|nr:ATP-binding protein [[Mycoplasma] testudinis]